jgi:hypothetical protein
VFYMNTPYSLILRPLGGDNRLGRYRVGVFHNPKYIVNNFKEDRNYLNLTIRPSATGNHFVKFWYCKHCLQLSTTSYNVLQRLTLISPPSCFAFLDIMLDKLLDIKKKCLVTTRQMLYPASCTNFKP